MSDPAERGSLGTRLAEWFVARALPGLARESVLGDLREEAARSHRRGSLWHLAAGLAVAAHVHAEPYRDASVRRALLLLLVPALTLLWLIPAAAGDAFAAVDLYPDPVSRLLARMWAASHLTSAAAAGLVVGHLPVLPTYAPHARWHAAVALGAAAAWNSGPAAALLLVAGAWLGVAGLEAGPAGSSTTRRTR